MNRNRVRWLSLVVTLVLIFLIGKGIYYWLDYRGLYIAIKVEDSEAITKIAKRHPSLLNAFSWSGMCPLIYAIEHDAKRSYISLLENGADPNRTGPFARSAIMLAPANTDAFWLRRALEYGADPNHDNQAKPSRRSRPLFSACRDEYLECARILVEEYHADVNCITQYHDPLVRASSSSQFKIVLLLLKNGADYRRKVGRYISFAGSIRHKKPSMFLKKENQEDLQAVIDWLKEQGVEYDKPKQDGDTWVY